MYAFILELSRKGTELSTGSLLTRIELEYRQRLSGKDVSVARLANSRYEVRFEHEDYNFNWCFAVADDLKLEAIELTIPNIVLPSARYDPLHRYMNGFFRAFPDSVRLPHLCCELAVDPRRELVKVRTEIGDEDQNKYRSGMFTVVHGVLNLGRMMKWLDRLAHAYEQKNYGMVDRATAKLVEAMARSAAFSTLP